MDNKFNLDSSSNTYKMTDKTDHDEIKIMKEDWEFIKDKVNNIKLSKFSINVTELLIGILVPYVFQFITASPEQKSFTEILWCLIVLFLWFIIKKIAKLCPKAIDFFGKSNEENLIHLEDISKKIAKVDTKEKKV